MCVYIQRSCLQLRELWFNDLFMYIVHIMYTDTGGAHQNVCKMFLYMYIQMCIYDVLLVHL